MFIAHINDSLSGSMVSDNKTSRLLLFFLLLGAAVSQEVITLTQTNFEENVNNGIWLIDFYAPWCGHCKKLAPVWEATAKELDKESIDVKLGKVDCTSEMVTESRYKEGKAVKEYKGPRLQEALVNHCKRISSPSVQTLTENEALFRVDELRMKGVVMAIVGEATEAFKSVAENHLEVPFLSLPQSLSASLGEKYGLKSGDIAAFNDVNGDRPYVYQSGDLNQWVDENKLNIFSWLEMDNYPVLLDSGRPLVIGFLGRDEESKQLRKSLKSAAIEDREEGRRFVMCVMDVTKKGHMRFLEELGVTQYPSVLILTLKHELVYPYEGGSFTEGDMKKFLGDFSAGNLSSRGIGGLSGFLRRNLWFVVGGLVALLCAFIFGIYYFIDDDETVPSRREPQSLQPEKESEEVVEGKKDK
ncbi:protein disulfide-isomerase TMX3 [Planoprotostelium fungivorum]|uniref:protein disulfide-isomerase n=1 Tax=Planoprotostelium fungivorum TaxID=1890364 RepID=A0A2P6NCP4_9EUKA|nr:protein disulfide-isomerase TMX3 [Planoprotostelium fungivorum]